MAHRLVYHSTLGLRVIKKKQKNLHVTQLRKRFRVTPASSSSLLDFVEEGVPERALLCIQDIVLRVPEHPQPDARREGVVPDVDVSQLAQLAHHEQPHASRLPVGYLRDAPQPLLFTLVAGPRRSLSLKLSDTKVFAPQIRARLGTTAHSLQSSSK